MSWIMDAEDYKHFPHIFVMNSHMMLEDLGIYDPDWGIDFDLGYTSGQFKYSDIGVPYDDSKYEGRQCAVFTYKHKMFGNGFWGDVFKNGHLHTKVLVPNNEIKLFETYVVSKQEHIVFFADIVRKPPITKNEGEFTLYELAPHLTPKELERMRKEVGEVVNYKLEVIAANKRAEKALSAQFIADARARAAEASILNAKNVIEHLMAQNNEMVQIMLDMGISTSQKFAIAAKSLEENMDLGIDWNQIEGGLLRGAASKGRQSTSFVESLQELKAGGITDATKEYIMESVVDVVGGVPVARQLLDLIEQKGSLRARSLTGMGMRILEERDRGNITPEQADSLSKQTHESVWNKYNETGDINSALEDVWQRMPVGARGRFQSMSPAEKNKVVQSALAQQGVGYD